MDVVENHDIRVDTLLSVQLLAYELRTKHQNSALPFVKNIAKDDTSISRRYLNRSLDVDKIMWPYVLRGRALNHLKVTQCCELHCEVLQGFGCLIYK